MDVAFPDETSESGIKVWYSYESFGGMHQATFISTIRDFDRHLCQQDDNLQSYGWIEHDGVNFGVQEIYDNDMKITTSFVKRPGGVNGGDWTARITVEPLVGPDLALCKF